MKTDGLQSKKRVQKITLTSLAKEFEEFTFLLLHRCYLRTGLPPSSPNSTRQSVIAPDSVDNDAVLVPVVLPTLFAFPITHSTLCPHNPTTPHTPPRAQTSGPGASTTQPSIPERLHDQAEIRSNQQQQQLRESQKSSGREPVLADLCTRARLSSMSWVRENRIKKELAYLLRFSERSRRCRRHKSCAYLSHFSFFFASHESANVCDTLPRWAIIIWSAHDLLFSGRNSG